MEDNELRDLESLFAQVEDPRMERTKLHRLRDIIMLAICGAEGWVEIEEFGKAKEAFANVQVESEQYVEKGHGRLEGREYWTIDDREILEYLDPQKRWKGLQAIGMVRSQRRTNQEVSRETRYYLLSLLRQEKSSRVGIHAKRLKNRMGQRLSATRSGWS